MIFIKFFIILTLSSAIISVIIFKLLNKAGYYPSPADLQKQARLNKVLNSAKKQLDKAKEESKRLDG